MMISNNVDFVSTKLYNIRIIKKGDAHCASPSYMLRMIFLMRLL